MVRPRSEYGCVPVLARFGLAASHGAVAGPWPSHSWRMFGVGGGLRSVAIVVFLFDMHVQFHDLSCSSRGLRLCEALPSTRFIMSLKAFLMTVAVGQKRNERFVDACVSLLAEERVDVSEVEHLDSLDVEKCTFSTSVSGGMIDFLKEAVKARAAEYGVAARQVASNEVCPAVVTCGGAWLIVFLQVPDVGDDLLQASLLRFLGPAKKKVRRSRYGGSHEECRSLRPLPDRSIALQQRGQRVGNPTQDKTFRVQ